MGVQKDWMKHCEEKNKKAAMKEGKNLKKVHGNYFLSEKKKGENVTRSRRGRNKKLEDNEVILGNFRSEIGRL